MQISPIKIQTDYSLFANKKPDKPNRAKLDFSNSKVNLLNACAIYNQALISFTGNDPYSYSEFIKTAEECGIDSIEALEKNITYKNLLGTGANSKVYKFNDERLNNWVLKADKYWFSPSCKDLFEPSKDDFKGKNMGQEIAKSGDKYRILKKIEGTPHSVNDWSYHIGKNTGVSIKEADDFLKSLKKISRFPQESFDDYAEQLKLLDQKGYKQDSINPNNLLIDYAKKKISIIDSFKKVSPLHVNTRHDLSSVLLDFSLFNLFYEKLGSFDKKALIFASNKIIKKCKIAAEKFDIQDDEKLYFGYLSNVDKYFGTYLVDKGGNYKERYDSMKNIIS